MRAERVAQIERQMLEVNCDVFVGPQLLLAGQHSLSCFPNSYLRHRDQIAGKAHAGKKVDQPFGWIEGKTIDAVPIIAWESMMVVMILLPQYEGKPPHIAS